MEFSDQRERSRKVLLVWKSDFSPVAPAALSRRGGGGGEKGMMAVVVYSSYPLLLLHFFKSLPNPIF